MKLKENFVLRNVADSWVVLPLGEATVNFNGMLTLNDSGALLWRVLEQGGGRDELVGNLLAEYDVAVDVAEADVDEFIEKLRGVGCIED